MIAIGKKSPAFESKRRRPSFIGVEEEAPKPAPAPEPPAATTTEPDGDEGAVKPNPAAVGYRDESQTCGQCTYFENDFCSHPIVAQAVTAGASCSAFEAGGGSPTQAGEAEMEPVE